MLTRAFTHGGRFHADDVFGAALLRIINPEIEIVRGFEVPEDFDGIVFDIGLGEYDHHQEDKQVRENGVAYAAFGLLWKEFGSRFMQEDEAKKFDEKFIQPLDICDNTGEYNELATIIGLFNPVWDSNADSNEAFFEAVEFAKKILLLKFEKSASILRAKEIVAEAIKNQKNGIMYLDQGAPWRQFVQNTDIEFVIFPSLRGGYNIQAVEMDGEDRSLKCPFPEIFRGKTSEELEQLSGVETFHFCHTSGFLAATKTLEDAYKVVDVARIKRAEALMAMMRGIR